MHKLNFAAGFGAGYVLGARAGRSRYESLKTQFEAIRTHPKTQDLTHAVQEKASEAATSVKSAATEKVQAMKSDDKTSSRSDSEQDQPSLVGPQGPLP